MHEGTKSLCSRLPRSGLYCNGIDSSSKQMGQPLYCSYTPREKEIQDCVSTVRMFVLLDSENALGSVT